MIKSSSFAILIETRRRESEWAHKRLNSAKFDWRPTKMQTILCLQRKVISGLEIGNVWQLGGSKYEIFAQ